MVSYLKWKVLTKKDIVFFSKNFSQYGTFWENALEKFDEDFVVQVDKFIRYHKFNLTNLPSTELEFGDNEETCEFNLNPWNGYGHYLHLSMYKHTGEIDGCSVGH